MGANLIIGIFRFKKGILINAIKLNFKIPDGILLYYPILNFDHKKFTPSLLICIFY